MSVTCSTKRSTTSGSHSSVPGVNTVAVPAATPEADRRDEVVALSESGRETGDHRITGTHRADRTDRWRPVPPEFAVPGGEQRTRGPAGSDHRARPSESEHLLNRLFDLVRGLRLPADQFGELTLRRLHDVRATSGTPDDGGQRGTSSVDDRSDVRIQVLQQTRVEVARQPVRHAAREHDDRRSGTDLAQDSLQLVGPVHGRPRHRHAVLARGVRLGDRDRLPGRSVDREPDDVEPLVTHQRQQFVADGAAGHHERGTGNAEPTKDSRHVDASTPGFSPHVVGAELAVGHEQVDRHRHVERRVQRDGHHPVLRPAVDVALVGSTLVGTPHHDEASDEGW